MTLTEVLDRGAFDLKRALENDPHFLDAHDHDHDHDATTITTTTIITMTMTTIITTMRMPRRSMT